MFKKNEPLDNLIQKIFNEEQKETLKKILWIYVCNVYVFNGMNDFKMVEPRIKCSFIPIALDNCHLVTDFRETDRIIQYRDRLAHNEIGFFAEHDGKMIGSIWATINTTATPRIAEKYFKIMPNEGHFHNIIVSKKFRGMRVGAFMESSMPAILFTEYGLNRVTTDVDVRNIASLGMLKQIGAQIDHKLLCISAFNRSVLQLVLRKYA
jgi:ribosomal protein S18 acetylase RimI-like enzyme